MLKKKDVDMVFNTEPLRKIFSKIATKHSEKLKHLEPGKPIILPMNYGKEG